MLRITRKLEKPLVSVDGPASQAVTLSLPYDDRKRGRLSCTLSDGRAAGLFLERGRTLLDGDLLQAENGELIRIQAAPEPVVEAHADDWESFAKVCYHLGNRHVPLQIGQLWLRFQPDHVLEDMVQLHGLRTGQALSPFQPESGAYGAHAHGHSHEHPHGHSHEHTHEHSQGNS